jgi:hypothetical protein
VSHLVGEGAMTARSPDDAIEQAQKVLGDKAKIPPPKTLPDKFQNDYEKAFKEFDAAREDSENKLLALENTVSAYTNAQQQNAAVYQREDFGLDRKSKDDAKKIKLAQKIFSDFFNNFQKQGEAERKVIDELDKHLIQLGRYKPSLK